MASTSATSIRAEYLKKYQSKNENKTKKKKKKLISTGMRIIEEDTFTQTAPDYKKDGSKRLKLLDKIKKEVSVGKWIKVGSDTDEEDRFENKQIKVTESFKTIDTIKEEIISDEDNSPKSSNTKKRKKKSRHNDDTSPIRQHLKQRSRSRENSTKNKFNESPIRKEKKRSLSKENSSIRRHKREERSPDRISRRRRSSSHDNFGKRRKHSDERDSEKQDNMDMEGYAKKRVTLFNKNRRHKGEEDEDPEQKQREAKKQEELNKKYQSWNKGVAQIKERKEALKEMEETMKEGFSRYADNEAMNEHLKNELHEEDPMAEYFMTKNQKIKMQTGIVYPTYKGQFPPNRFSISPGYRWDGVNRSNGFEAKMAITLNKKRAENDDAYRSIAECAE